jgi:ectoine hydroxylase-related dioxygenase (phytanoyl-CoA dioxygenase family)
MLMKLAELAQTDVALETDIATLRRDGYVVLRGLLSSSQVKMLRGELQPWLDRTPRSQGDFYGWNTTRVGGLLAKAPLVQHMVLHWRALAIAETLLKLNCDCIQLNLTQATCVHPGERAQVPHRDEEMWPTSTHGRDWMLNVLWAVDDFTEENGATRVWPGSHRAELDRDIDPAAAIAAEMPSGSALVFLGSLTHGAGANRSQAPRTGVIVSYCLGWLRSYENQFLAYPRGVVRYFPEPLQRLIGYQIHRPNLGAWEGRDPVECLEGEAGYHPWVDALTPEIAGELRAYYGAEDRGNGD